MVKPPPQAHNSQISSHSDHLSTTITLFDPLWYPDSGASHHINDSTNLSSKSAYTGNEHITLGNGIGL